jgi:dTDP-4-amino-4,6-dideoxygalactose transaminase
MTIPLLDIAAQHLAIRPELDCAIARVLEHGRFVNGHEVASFEEAFSAYCDVGETVGLSSGTDALSVGLMAAGVGVGDEVILPAMTFIATAESVAQAGARPVIVDCDPDTALMNLEAAEAAITERTAAVLPVHLYGQCVDLDAFARLTARHGLLLVEDAAQAHGAASHGRKAGSVGAFAAFSFFPGKNLGALGDAGALTTNDTSLAARARKLRDHGRVDKYRHDELGVNARLDTLQAAVLEVKLGHLDDWNEARRMHAQEYDRALAGVAGIAPLRTAPGALHVYHQYVVRVRDRERAIATLGDGGIATGIHYPVPLHRQPSLSEFTPGARCSEADALAHSVLSLPVFPELTAEQRTRVVDALIASAEQAGRFAAPRTHARQFSAQTRSR